MPPAKTPLTRGTKGGGSELTDRGQSKLKAQIRRAQGIMEAEVKAGNHLSETFKQARTMKGRAEKLLGKTAPKASPGKSQPNKHDERRRPFERATPGDPAERLREIQRNMRSKATLIGVAKRANKANEA